MVVAHVHDIFYAEKCLCEKEIETARSLLKAEILTIYEYEDFSVFPQRRNLEKISQLTFRLIISFHGIPVHYFFLETEKEKIVEISIHGQTHASVVFAHARMTERTKLYELKEIPVLSGVFPGRPNIREALQNFRIGLVAVGPASHTQAP